MTIETNRLRDQVKLFYRDCYRHPEWIEVSIDLYQKLLKESFETRIPYFDFSQPPKKFMGLKLDVNPDVPDDYFKLGRGEYPSDHGLQ